MALSLVCQNVSLYRRRADGAERAILQGLNATLNAGQVIMVSGETGAGKSTLLHLFAGLLRPSEGRIIVNGQTVSGWNTVHRDRWRRQVGIVFQHPHLLSDLTVLENVILPMIPRGGSIARLRMFAWEAIEACGIRHLAGQNAAALSGGEQQRVSIARAIISRPAILIADEPTAHQDDEGTELIINNLIRWKRPDNITIIAAHDPRWERHEAFFDKHFSIENGRLKEFR